MIQEQSGKRKSSEQRAKNSEQRAEEREHTL
jgi:hypothetical protein